jgi:methylenetetrahydrofolate reductase (NADPH)
MVAQIAATNRGEYLDPTLRDPAPTSFCIGIAGYPEKHAEAPNLEHDIAMLKKKVDAGADYIVTQMFFINERFFSFVEQCRNAGITVPIIPGIKPIQRKSDIDLLPQTFRVDLPVSLVKAIEESSSAAQVRRIGIDYCIDQVTELIKAKVPGVHFYTQGRAEPIAKIVEATFDLG